MLINLPIMFFFSADLSNCKLISFPDGVFKVLRSVSENINVISLADNEMKALPSKFFSTFTQLRGSVLYTLIHGLSLRENKLFFSKKKRKYNNTRSESLLESFNMLQNWTCKVTFSPNYLTLWRKWSIWPASIWLITASPSSLISSLK